MEKLIFLLLLSVSLQGTYYSVDEFFDLLKQETYSSGEAKTITNTLAKFFKETYPFVDLAKNPPQPDFNNTYYEKVDIYQKLLDYTINGDSITKYQLYRDVSLIIHELNDLHISVYFNTTFIRYGYVLPLKLVIKMKDGKPVVYTELIEETFHDVFSESLLEKVKKNLNSPVKLINEKSPFNYIEEFCDNFVHVKNLHGSFSDNYYALGQFSLGACPLTYEELKNFDLVYENGEKITTEYKIYYGPDYKLNTNALDNQSGINWDYHYTNQFQCKIDEENKINFIVSKTYIPDDLNLFYNALENCFKKIYENDYPIIYLSENNGGGYDVLYHIMAELLMPTHSFNGYIAVGKNLIYYFKKQDLRNKDTYEEVDENYLKNTTSKYFSNTYINSPLVQNAIEYLQNNLKINSKKRKPTEIILFTDGSSYSAASCLIKGAQNRGSAIAVGYLGDPLMSDYPFDSSHSCTAVTPSDELKKINGFYSDLEKMGVIAAQISGKPLFKNKTSSDFPMEYQVFPVDEYFKFYELLNKDTYISYVNEAKKIIEKYKEQCNKNNKNLLLLTKECDGKFGNRHMHGGFECGDDGKWSQNCVPSYCDEEFIFDVVDKKCVERENFMDYGIDSIGIFFFIVCMVLVLLVIAGFIYYIISSNKESMNKDN